jgi:hypothetical protein
MLVEEMCPAPVSVKELSRLLIDLEMAGHGDKPVFLSSDPEGNGFNGFFHTVESPGISYDGVKWDDTPVVVLWAGAPERVELEFDE